MGLFDGLGKLFGAEKEEEVNIEEALNELDQEEAMKKNPPADFYVKSITLEDEQVLQTVYGELEQRNIVILKLTPVMRQQARFKRILDSLKEHLNKIGGDIAAVDENRLLLTPARVKIVKAMKK